MLVLKEIAAASVATPAADKQALFLDTDGAWKVKDEAAAVTIFAKTVSPTLTTPSLAGLGNYVDDAAAAAGGVAVGGVYRNGSVLQIRVA